MTTDVAIGSGDLTKLGVGLTIALVVVAVLIVLAVKALVVRVVTVAVVVVLGVLVWQQREHVQDVYRSRLCNTGPEATYFGIHVDPPQDSSVRCAG